MYLLLFSFGLMYQGLDGAIPSWKCSIKAPAKWRNSVYVLVKICHQRSKWLGPKYTTILPDIAGLQKTDSTKRLSNQNRINSSVLCRFYLYQCWFDCHIFQILHCQWFYQITENKVLALSDFKIRVGITKRFVGFYPSIREQ